MEVVERGDSVRRQGGYNAKLMQQKGSGPYPLMLSRAPEEKTVMWAHACSF